MVAILIGFNGVPKQYSSYVPGTQTMMHALANYGYGRAFDWKDSYDLLITYQFHGFWPKIYFEY